MITFFTTAKPFKGHSAIIQRNALQSWKLLHPDVEVILFGDDEGAADVCAEFGLRHEPHVERHESGTKCLNYMFARAQQLSHHQHLCFSNCDIILMSDFAKASQIASAWRKRFLMVARRWDTDVTSPIDFSRPDWASTLRQLATTKGFQQDEYWIDVFLFTKGLYVDMPPLIVGHCHWDNWMIWKALSSKVPVLDASRFITPVHQNHGYNPKFGRNKGNPDDPLSLFNLMLIGDTQNLRQIDAATHRITQQGWVQWNPTRLRKASKRLFLGKLFYPVWFSFLDLTRPLRTRLGFRSRVSKPL